MNHIIANWYKSKLTAAATAGDIVWLETVAGLVRTVSVQRPVDQKGNTVTQRFPVSVEVDSANCETPASLKQLAPDSSKRSVLYFEDGGGTTEIRNGRRVFISSLRLVCWVNAKKLTFPGDDPTPIMIAQILDTIPGSFENYGTLSAIRNVSIDIAPVGSNLFAGYTYDQGKQLLFKPYHAFALDLQTIYNVPGDCSGLIELNDDPCA